jgi:hypothetical protein
MDKILQLINQAYGKDGYKFEQEVTVPILNRKVKTVITINATSPTKFVFTATQNGGSIAFEPGVRITIPMIFNIVTTLTKIDFDSTNAHIYCTGCPTIHIPLSKV